MNKCLTNTGALENERVPLLLLLHVVIACAVFPHHLIQGEQTGFLEGLILEKTSKQPVEFVNVVIPALGTGASSNNTGHFRLSKIPVGTYTITFSLIGFKERRIDNVTIAQGKNSLDVLLEESSVEAEEVVITPKSERYDASGITARLGAQMVSRAPGSAQDIFWVVQTLPGIASDGDNSKLYVRGGNPDENLVVYDGATIRNPFHFDMMGGGYWSVFNSRLVDKVEFFAGGFPARYGDRLTSVLVIENRSGDKNKISGEGSISMSDASGTLEVPLSFLDGSALFSARRSYFDVFLQYTDLAADYSVLPYFFDLNSKIDFSVSTRHKATFTSLYSQEKMYGYFDRPNYTGNFEWKNNNSVFTARLRSIFNDFFLSDFIVSFSRAKSSSEQPRNAKEIYDIQELAVKQDFTIIFAAHELHAGGWLINEREDITINLPREIALNFAALQLQGKGVSVKPSLYVDDKINISPALNASIGLRYDHVRQSNESTISPRFNISYAWNEHMSLSADYGIYYQSPRPFELDINNTLQSRRAESYGIGLKHEMNDEIVVSVEFYNKNLSKLIMIDSLWNLSNNGEGYSRGAEFYVQVKDPGGFFGWLSYTYSSSQRKEGTSSTLHYFDYDRPHLVSLVANYSVAEFWHAGIRFRYGSGRPYTPVASAWYDPAENRWFPVPDVHNSDRYPAYHRLDVRITRQFLFQSFTVDCYLEILNVYNRKNIVHYMWDETYSSKERLTIIPLLPVVGISAKF